MVVGFMVLAACQDPGPPSEPVYDPPSVEPLSLTLSAAINPHNPHSALASVTASADALATIEATDGERTVSTPPVSLAAGAAAEVLVLGLRADRTWTLTAVAEDTTSAPISVTTDALPADHPDCTVTVDTGAEVSADEVICTNADTDSGGIYFCVDRAGETVWSVAQPEGEGVHAFRVLSDGTLAMVSDSRSMIAFLEPSGAPITYYTPSWFKGQTRFQHEWIDLHEVIEITDGQWTGAVAVLTSTYEKIPDDRAVRAPGILIFDPQTGTTLWDWHMLGESLEDGQTIDPLLDFSRVGLYSTDADWVHANALLHRVEDGRDVFWMSLRHQDWIIKIDGETDGVLWRLGAEGDFTLVDDLAADSPQPLPADDWMYQQHAPEWQTHVGGQTAFVVFDNGLVRPTSGGLPYSRVLGFVIDEDTMQAAPTFAYGSDTPPSEDHFFSTGVGDADLTPAGDRLHFVKGYDPDPFLGEVSHPEGTLLWKMVCSDQDELYRLSAYPSLYALTWRTD